MYNLNLFLGVERNACFQRAIDQANLHLVSFLIGKEDYLSEVIIEDKHYVGKPVPLFCSVEQLEHLQIHLLSLLKKLAPTHFFLPTLVTQVNDTQHH